MKIILILIYLLFKMEDRSILNNFRDEIFNGKSTDEIKKEIPKLYNKYNKTFR